jgi:hypothetical protein
MTLFGHAFVGLPTAGWFSMEYYLCGRVGEKQKEKYDIPPFRKSATGLDRAGYVFRAIIIYEI